MDFISAVNRVMRISGILGNDDDNLTSFSTTQHAATLELAKIAIQSELSHLVAQEAIPYEDDVAEFTLVAGQRVYDLASDFVGFTDRQPYLAKVTDGTGAAESTVYYEYKGGEEALRAIHPDYRDTQGDIINWYLPGGASKTIGIWHVPDANADLVAYRYYYQKSITVSLTSDTIPLQTEQESQMFVDMCARRFKYLTTPYQLRERIFPGGIEKDAVLLESRATLMALVNPKRLKIRYGRKHDTNRLGFQGGVFN